MYRDNDSIKVFERQHARETLAKFARQRSHGSDMDLLTAHCGLEREEAWLTVAISIVAVFVLGGLIFVGLG